MRLNPTRSSFGYDKLEFVTREPLKRAFMAGSGHVPPSGDWLDETYRYMVTKDVGHATGALEVFWEPRKWVWSTFSTKVIFNPARAGLSGWQTWTYLTSNVLSWLSNARIRRLDTKLDFNNTLAEVLSSLALKGARSVYIDPRGTIYSGEMGGVQLVIYDKGLKEDKVADRRIRVEIRQWFHTDNHDGHTRPFMMNFMRGDLLGTNPFRHVAWVDPDRLDPRVRALAEEKGLNYAMLPESGLSIYLRETTRRQIRYHGTNDPYQLYLAEAEPWHRGFVNGLALENTMRAERQAANDEAWAELFGPSTTTETDVAATMNDGALPPW